LRLCLALILVSVTSSVLAESAEPDGREADEFDFMNVLSDHGLHDLTDELWNAYGQATYIYSWKPQFPALYTNLHGTPNSLLPQAETSFTATATGFFGVKAWEGARSTLSPR